MADNEREALARMTALNSGDSAMIARAYYDSLLIRIQYIGSTLADTGCEIWGEKFSSPLSVSSVSHLGKFGYGENAMIAVARAASELNILHFTGAGSKEELEQIIATGAKTVKIIKPFADNEIILDKIAHARAAGAFGVGMDIDHTFTSAGTYDQFEGKPLGTKTVEDLAAFVKAAGDMPFILKGVLSTSDAEKCIEAGVRGIYVSNHHGIARYMTPPAMMLPEITAAAKGRLKIFIDSSVESGYDAFKALALGADNVGVARPLLAPVKQDGVEGVKRWFEKANNELRSSMSRSGCARVSDIDVSHIVKYEHKF